MSNDLSHLLKEWPYDSDDNIRIVVADDGRRVMQVRQPLGIEQYELDGRPDGSRPHGEESIVEYLDARIARHRESHGEDEQFELTHEECQQMQSEGILYYYRYLLLFQVNDFERVVRDTRHNLRICELLQSYCRNDEDRNAVLQFKPYIVRMNAMARAMQKVQDHNEEAAVELLTKAVTEIQNMKEIESAAFQFERVRSVNYLRSAIEQIRGRPADPRKKLERELELAVESEDYERAARLRDRIRDLS